jgi:hypothetical protein
VCAVSSEHDDDILISGTTDDREQDRPPRRRRLTVAAVAAAVLVAAGGGAYWAVSSDGGGGRTPTAHATLPSKDPSAGTGRSAADAGGDYRLTGTLPVDGPKSAALYRPDGGADRAAVGRLAVLLGVVGPVVEDHGSWLVGSADGTGPALLASKDAPGTWSYAHNGQVAPGARTVVPPALPQIPPPSGSGQADPGTTSHDAVGMAPDSGGSGASGDSGTDGGAPPVSEQRAKAAAAPVLDGIGLAGARVDASRTVTSTRTVTADPVVGGLPTHGWDTTLEIDPNGRVIGGHGRLSALAKGDTYPVIGAAEAFKELSSARVMQPDHRMSCQVPMPDGGTAQNGAGSAASPTSPGQDKTLPHSLPCVAPRVLPIDITGAEFGLASEFVPGGQALVPAWLFDAVPEGATAGSVIARQAVDPAVVQGGGNAPGGPSPASPATPPPAGPGGAHRMTVTGYQQHGGSLTLTFWGGVCETYTATAAETSAQVRVSVTGKETKPGAFCPAMLKRQTASVQLDGPLGGRTVVDAASGAPVKGS